MKLLAILLFPLLALGQTVQINQGAQTSGRATGGGGNVSNSGTPAQHQTAIWQSATTISGIGPGTTGQILTSNGAAADPSWQTPPGTGLPTVAITGSVLGASAANTWSACPPGAVASIMTWNLAGCPGSNSFAVVGVRMAGTYNFTSLTIQGGIDSTYAGTTGGLTLRGGDQLAGGAAGAQAGSLTLRGGNNLNTNVAISFAGSAGMYGGASISPTNTGHQGFLQTGSYYRTGATVTAGNLQQATSVAETTADAVATPAYVLGVAQNVGAVAVLVVDSGEVQVNASAAVTIGHTVCAGATAGQVTDSGGTGACTTGFLFGVVTRISGAYTMPDGTAISLTNLAPAVKILGLK